MRTWCSGFIIIISVQCVYHFKCTGLHARVKSKHARCACALCYIRYAYSSILAQRAKDFFILTFNGALAVAGVLQHHSLVRVRYIDFISHARMETINRLFQFKIDFFIFSFVGSLNHITWTVSELWWLVSVRARVYFVLCIWLYQTNSIRFLFVSVLSHTRKHPDLYSRCTHSIYPYFYTQRDARTRFVLCTACCCCCGCVLKVYFLCAVFLFAPFVKSVRDCVAVALRIWKQSVWRFLVHFPLLSVCKHWCRNCQIARWKQNECAVFVLYFFSVLTHTKYSDLSKSMPVFV